MGIHDFRVISKLGQKAWDALLEEVNNAIVNGTINAEHMKDIASALHKRVGAKHRMRVDSSNSKRLSVIMQSFVRS